MPVSPLAFRSALEVLLRAASPLTASEVARAVRARGVAVSTRALELSLQVAKTVEAVPSSQRPVRYRIKQVRRRRVGVPPRPRTGGTEVVRDPWPGQFQGAAAALFETSVDAVVVQIRDPAKATALFEIRMDRVVVATPQVAIAMPLAGRSLAAAASRAGLDCWPWPWQPRLGQRSTLGGDATLSAAAPALGVVCDRTPQEACARVRELLQTHLAIADSDRVSITALHCDDAEEMRRIAELEHLPRRRGHGGGARRGPVVSSCDRCGQPLSDPYSVSIGVGPECQKYYNRTLLNRLRQHPGVEPRAWIGVKDHATWLTEIRAALLKV